MKKWSVYCMALFFFITIPIIVSAKSLKGYQKDFNKALRSGDGDQMAEVIQNIADLNTKKAVQFILKVALATENLSQGGLKDTQLMKLYDAGLSGLRKISEPRAVSYLLKQSYKSRNWKIRVMLIDVLKDMDSEEARNALVKNLKRGRQEVLLAVISAVKEKKMKKAIPGLIEVFGKYKRQKGLVWIETRRALLAITGQDFEKVVDWKKWWTVVKGSFNPNESAHRGGSGKTVIRKRKRRPKLFGSEVVSKRVVFVIDVSGSMTAKDPVTSGEGSSGGHKKTTGRLRPRSPGTGTGTSLPENRMRIKRAKRELTKVIKMLDRDVNFNIVSFSNVIRVWKDKSLYRANSGNKGSAIKWIQNMQASGFTWTDEALKKAFFFKSANTIYLLSDGSPTKDGSNIIPTGQICDMVKNLNKFRKVRIYTLGFVGANKELMQRLADENNGKCSDIR